MKFLQKSCLLFAVKFVWGAKHWDWIHFCRGPAASGWTTSQQEEMIATLWYFHAGTFRCANISYNHLVSLSVNFFTATNRSNQIASTVSQGGVRVKIFPIYCHILSFSVMIASPSASFMSFSYILRTLMQFHCNLLYTHSPNAMIQEYIWIKELDISKSCTIIFISAEMQHLFLLFTIDTAPDFLGAQNSDRELKRREFQICNFRHE